MVTLDNWEELLHKCASINELDDLKLCFLGKKGVLTAQMKALSSLQSIDEKKENGAILNKVRENFQLSYDEKKEELNQLALNKKLEEEFVDLTLPHRPGSKGCKHILSSVSEEITHYFQNIGFSLQHAPNVDSEENNFDALNIPSYHPARQSQDTFYIKENLQSLLRTHTSNTQIRAMKEHKPPFRFMSLGRCYRRDAVDATHTPMFHQLELFAVDRNMNMANLKTTIINFLRHFFNDDQLKIRLRPSFFPFTTPSAEVDIEMKGKGWLEVLGCGLIHPNVFNNCGIDSNEFQGFAAGMGIERLAMLKYGINDIRYFYDNDKRFLKAFSL